MAEERILVSEFMKRWNDYSPSVRIRTRLEGDYVIIPNLAPPGQESSPEPMIPAALPTGLPVQHAEPVSIVDQAIQALPLSIRGRRQRWPTDRRPHLPAPDEDLSSLLMQLPAENKPYPFRSIDHITGYYHRWRDPGEACTWVRELAKQDYVLLDVETTGSMRSSQVIELAVLDRHGERLFHSLFCPTTSIDPFASAVHGMTWKDVKDAPSFDQLHTNLYTCLRGRLVLAYNASFDIRLLFQTARAFQVPFPRLETACLMWCYSKIRGERTQSGQYRRFPLGMACLHMGIHVPVQEYFGEQIVLINHRAEGDARYLHQFAQHLIEHVCMSTAD